MRVKWILPVLLFSLIGCAVQPTALTKVALLAPFEGRYREIGYNALYAARMAVDDVDQPWIHLLAVDDGGSIASAVDRAHALAEDPAVRAVLLIGPYATDILVQEALGGVQAVIIGHWGAEPGPNTVILTNPEIADISTLPPQIGVVQAAEITGAVTGSDLLALTAYPILRQSAEDITIVSSGSLPGEIFAIQYQSIASFTPDPGLLATLVYDAAGMAVQSVIQQAPIAQLEYEGINGSFSFADGYWVEAPINRFHYSEAGRLVPITDSNSG